VWFDWLAVSAEVERNGNSLVGDAVGRGGKSSMKSSANDSERNSEQLTRLTETAYFRALQFRHGA